MINQPSIRCINIPSTIILDQRDAPTLADSIEQFKTLLMTVIAVLSPANLACRNDFLFI